MPSLIDSIAKTMLTGAKVVYKQQLAPHVFHIQLHGKEFINYAYIPGEHLRLAVGMDKNTGLDEKVRTYSIWKHNATTGTVDLAICTHSNGIGANWVQQVNPGDTIYYMGPKRKLLAEKNGDHFIFIGDLSGLSHLYALKQAVTGNKKITGIIYGTDQADYFADIDGSRPFTFTKWPDNPSSQIIAQLEELKNQNTGATVAYLAGDARVCKTISQYLRNDAHWSKATILTKGFWMPGKTGMD